MKQSSGDQEPLGLWPCSSWSPMVASLGIMQFLSGYILKMGENEQNWLKNLYYVPLGSLTPITVDLSTLREHLFSTIWYNV